MAKKQTLIQRSRQGATPAEKATFHVFGGGKTPERDFFGLTPQDEEQIEKELDQSLQVNLDRQG